MAHSIVLGNGKTLIGLDRYGRTCDLYFPHVGQENQIREDEPHRMGIYINGELSWIGEDHRWQIDVQCEEDSLSSVITATHPTLQVSLLFKDVVYNEHAIFVRRISIQNLADYSREIKFYFAHQFELSKSHLADTAYFDPKLNAIVHYKGQRVFMINGELEGAPLSDYTLGLAGFQGKEGSHRDAEDGALSKNPIEHGRADSAIGYYAVYEPNMTKTLHYWIVAAKSIAEAKSLHDIVVKKTPEHILKTTSDFWKAWVNKYNFSFFKLSPEIVRLFKQSLMIVRAHVDASGAIIASGDSDMLQQGKDTYAYMWPRDATFAAMALDKAGDQNVARHFFEFCRSILHEDGYLMHKYLPDGSLGSSWHPYIRNGKFQLPIQEDETAIVLWGLREHYQRTHDIEFIEEIYNDTIERTANFMCEYRNPYTKLPQGSYDLWEEKHGTTTFTCSAVYGALTAAAEFSKLLGKKENQAKYTQAADEIQQGIMHHLYNESTGNFFKLIKLEEDEGKTIIDETMDVSSVFGIFTFGVLPIDDERLIKAVAQTHETLTRNIDIHGIARYEGDQYGRLPHMDIPGNPWIITTLWMTQWSILHAKDEADFENIREQLQWVARYASPSGILSEQLNPVTGAPISATPLTWSHAEFVNTVIKYLNRLETLGICVACNPVP